MTTLSIPTAGLCASMEWNVPAKTLARTGYAGAKTKSALATTLSAQDKNAPTTAQEDF